MKTTFTHSEREALLHNEHVVRCSATSITYSPAFKVLAVKRYQEGLSPQSIFREAGFDLRVIGRQRPKWLLRDWSTLSREQGLTGLQKEGRGSSGKGGRPKTKSVTDEERIKQLEAKVAYLKAENDFLAKLRAKRKE